MEPCIRRKILRRAGSGTEEVEDLLATERQLVISVNGKKVLSLYCTPTMIQEFVVGFLLNEGIIKGQFCADAITVESNADATISVNVPVEGEASTDGLVRTSGCIGGLTFERKDIGKAADGFFVTSDAVLNLYREFNQSAVLFKATGCTHSAAIADGKNILVIAEDIGRHNAVDKVIGHCILENISFNDTVMMVSGRLSSEIVSKCARWGIPILVSRTSPTSYAVEIAELANITLIGFVRGGRFNMYSHGRRII